MGLTLRREGVLYILASWIYISYFIAFIEPSKPYNQSQEFISGLFIDVYSQNLALLVTISSPQEVNCPRSRHE
jgi:hypothetical protein